MRKMVGKSLLLLFAVMFVASTSIAQANSGFPSGQHYNLNIIGKKADFTCPAAEYDLNGNLIYGNVVFVPETGTGSQIQMVSGKGKTASTFTELKAIDPCAGFDGNPARIQLPRNDAGYRVYARALAKPTDTPETATMSLTPGLSFVQDETSTDLVYIGLVTANGFDTSYQVTRLKGKSPTVNLSDMFKWAGTVCYKFPPVNDLGALEQGFLLTPMCWVDANVVGGDTLYNYGDSILAPTNGICSSGVLQDLYCQTYSEQWVFNIADLVEYFWSLDTNGSKLVQIRFYPN
jgi:hypothetical protein